MDKLFSVAIDGPSGAGKSTLAKAAAERFGFIYVDTGAIYRTVGLAAKRLGTDVEDEAAVSAILPTLDIRLAYDAHGNQRMYLNGEDVTEAIRMPDISMYASAVSALPAVRRFLLDMQRELAKRQSVVMDGRDIGSVVLPDADLKVYLTASEEKRAQRRYAELCEKGVVTTTEQVLEDITARDARDSSRSAAPLTRAEGAVLLDTSELTLEESVAELCRIIEAKRR